MQQKCRAGGQESNPMKTNQLQCLVSRLGRQSANVVKHQAWPTNASAAVNRFHQSPTSIPPTQITVTIILSCSLGRGHGGIWEWAWQIVTNLCAPAVTFILNRSQTTGHIQQNQRNKMMCPEYHHITEQFAYFAVTYTNTKQQPQRGHQQTTGNVTY